MKELTNKIIEYFNLEDENYNISSLGLVDSKIEGTITFVDDEKYIKEAVSNDDVNAIIITKNLYQEYCDKTDKKLIISDDPRYDFYSIQNELAVENFKNNRFESEVHESAEIHETSFVAKYNVKISKNVTIEPNVTILENVIIGEGTHVSAGTVIGAEGFEHKRTSKGILSVKHDGKVIIGKKVFIGALNGISKGFSFQHTVIDDETKTDNLVHIAHGVHVGKRCFLPASCVLSGSVTLGDDVWVGPNATVSSQINVANQAYITLGSVVTRDVERGKHVTGNFAIDHKQYLKVLKNNLRL